MLNLKPVFCDLEIEKAIEANNLHEVGRLLRTCCEFIDLEDDVANVRNFSYKGKAAFRNLTRRNPTDD